MVQHASRYRALHDTGRAEWVFCRERRFSSGRIRGRTRHAGIPEGQGKQGENHGQEGRWLDHALAGRCSSPALGAAGPDPEVPAVAGTAPVRGQEPPLRGRGVAECSTSRPPARPAPDGVARAPRARLRPSSRFGERILETPPGARPASPRLPAGRRSESAGGPPTGPATERRAGPVPGGGRPSAGDEAGVPRRLPGEAGRGGRGGSYYKSMGHGADCGPAGGLTRHRMRRPGRSAGLVAEVVLWRGGSSARTMKRDEAMSGRPHSRRMDPWVRDTQIEGIS